MATNYNPRLVTNGLAVCVDPGNPKSYPGTGSTLTNLASTSDNGTLGAAGAAPTFSSTEGGYFSFNGSQYVTFTNSPAIQSTTALTVHAWAHLSSWSGNASNIKIFSCTEASGWQIAHDGSAVIVMAHIGGAYRAASIAKASVSGGWHMVCGTFDGQYLRLYLDGLLVHTYDHGSVAGITATGAKGMIGGEPDGSGYTGNGWTGRISQVGIYGSALTAAQVRQNFQALRGRYAL